MKFYVFKSIDKSWVVIDQQEHPVDDIILSRHETFEEAIAAAFIYAKRALVGGSY